MAPSGTTGTLRICAGLAWYTINANKQNVHSTRKPFTGSKEP